MGLPFAKAHVSNGKVFSFEPDEENYSKLLINAELNSLGNFFPKKMALQNSDSVKELSFFIRSSIDGDGNNNF